MITFDQKQFVKWVRRYWDALHPKAREEVYELLDLADRWSTLGVEITRTPEGLDFLVIEISPRRGEA